MGRVRGREGGAVLESRETYSSTGGHGNSDAPYQNDRWQTETCKTTNGCTWINWGLIGKAELILRLELGVA